MKDKAANRCPIGRTKCRIILAIVLTCLLGTTVLGCSYLNMRPPIARIQLKSGPYELKEFVVDLDVPMQRNLDVYLSEHYALQFDLIFNPGAPASMDLDFNLPGSDSPALSPLVICKYWF